MISIKKVLTKILTTLANVGTDVAKQAAASGTTSVPNTTATAITSVDLAAGTWVVIGTVNYAAGGTSGTYRRAALGSSSTGTQYGYAQVASPSSGLTVVQVVAVVPLASAATVYLSAQQGSGSAINVNNSTSSIKAVRIK